jgi:phenylacetate-coenzyme A ligase PaaK-like adenylate-forming protein
MASLRSKLGAYVNFSARLRAFVRDTVTLEEARQALIEQHRAREQNFLSLLKTNVFEYSASPYRNLLDWAGLAYQDVKRMVSERGLESTLEALHEAGVYVTFEEFKGRAPIRRGSREFSPDESDFDNPDLDSLIRGSSGGSSGRPTRSTMDLGHIAQCAKQAALCQSSHGVFDAPIMTWWGLLPDTMGLMTGLRPAHLGQHVSRWFITFGGNESKTGWRYFLMSYLVILMARFHGLKIPFPERTPLDQPLPVAQALHEVLQDKGKVFMVTSVSKCVRISAAAQENGIDLTGVTFLGASEPVTQAKYDAVRASGARFMSLYGTSETGHVGLPCLNPADLTDMHFLDNNLAMIQRPRDVLGQSVNVFHFTSLLPTNPKMMINVESDDFGIVEQRDCGCPLHDMGFHTHLRQMGSYSKLTGEGVTLIGSDMERILEEELPSKFGGSPLDYQLVEEESAEGLTRLVLYVSPAVSVREEKAILEAFLFAMEQGAPSVRLARAEFQTGGVITIRREKPILTDRGKHFPIRTLNMKQNRTG